MVKTKYVLSLAGGGIRGALTASYLEKLEQFLLLHTGNTIYEQFDLFSGSSTGGLIVGGFVYGGLRAKEITDKYYNHENATRIMKQTWTSYILGLVQNRPKYDGIGKKSLIQETVGNKTMADTTKRVLIPVYDITHEEPVYVKSWGGKQKNCDVGCILDATSAAPGYFPCVEYMPNRWGIDGSVVDHNPTMAAYIEAKRLWPEDKITIISIGTGQTYPGRYDGNTKGWGSIQWATKGDMIDILLDAPMEGTTKLAETLVGQNGDRMFHVDYCIPNTSMDNVSPENIENLKSTGREWWELTKHEIMSCFPQRKLGIYVVEESVFM